MVSPLVELSPAGCSGGWGGANQFEFGNSSEARSVVGLDGESVTRMGRGIANREDLGLLSPVEVLIRTLIDRLPMNTIIGSLQ